jgi:DNA mismatch repair protein MutL
MITKAIERLAPEVSAKIAAGEVIERPASVVKELVENALDAGASTLHITIRNGGRDLIAVADDGFGIEMVQLPLALGRHATSKLRNADDLAAVTTLGFRGEALASIAAAAHIEVLSATASGEGGIISAENGEIEAVKSSPRARGTTVTVRDLFRYTPARLKFLKSVGTEHARIHDVIAAYGLAFPHVAMSLTVEDRLTFSVPGDGDPRTVLRELYGESATQFLTLKVGHRLPTGTSLSGFVGTPLLHRASRDHIWLYVNQRWITSRPLSHAVEQAYRTLLMTGRHPVAVLYLTVDPSDVDVNVHPTKSEVKLRPEHALFGGIVRCVQDTVMAAPVVPVASLTPTPDVQLGMAQTNTASIPVGVVPSMPETTRATGPMGSAHQEMPVVFPEAPALRVMGQVDSTYIIAEGPRGLYMIDQHAAHERIMFDKISGMAEAKSNSRTLLQPLTLELGPAQSLFVEEHLAEFTALGYAFEPFGTRTMLVRAVPTILGSSDPMPTILSIIDELRAEGTGALTFGEAAQWSVACKAAIKAGQPLSRDEQVELVRQLEATRSPQTCAHGRPTMMHLSVAQLERQFGRK